MNNQIAFTLVALILTVWLADHFWLHLDLPLQAGRQFTTLVEYLSFWR